MSDSHDIRQQHIRQLEEIRAHVLTNGLLKPSKVAAFKLLIAIHIESSQQYGLNLFE